MAHQKKKRYRKSTIFGRPTINICERSFTFMNDMSIHGNGALCRHHNGFRIDRRSNALLQHMYESERKYTKKVLE